jgi:hypothetical protein
MNTSAVSRAAESKELSIPFIRIEGWFFVGPEKDCNIYMLDRIRLNPRFIKSIRRLNPSVLEISDMKRIQGSLWSPKYVIGVYSLDEKDSTVPFFISEEQVENLKSIITCSHKDIYLY